MILHESTVTGIGFRARRFEAQGAENPRVGKFMVVVAITISQPCRKPPRRQIGRNRNLPNADCTISIGRWVEIQSAGSAGTVSVGRLREGQTTST